MKVEKTIKLDIPLIEDIIFISSSVFLYHAHHSCSEWQMNDLFNAVKSMCTYMLSWTGHWNQLKAASSLFIKIWNLGRVLLFSFVVGFLELSPFDNVFVNWQIMRDK